MKLTLSRGEARTAFTLIELMVVVVLIGVLSAVIIPEMKGTFEDALLRSTSRELVNAFSLASSRAISLNQLHRVRLDPRTGRYVVEKRIHESPDGDEFEPVKDISGSEGDLDSRITIQIHRPGEAPPASGSENAPAPAAAAPDTAAAPVSVESISFYGDGTADPAELLLQDRQGFRVGLRVNRITSRVQILELERQE